MLLDTLLARRLLFVSGKGGVGKSVVALSLAMAAVRRGKRVLLVQIEAPLDVARYLGGSPKTDREQQVLPGLLTLNLAGRQVMDEYVRRTVKLEIFVRRILRSPVYQRFFAAAPGLPDLMLLGKILFLEEQNEKGRRPRFDWVVVDAPATGHGLAFLKVPQAASRAIPVGPVGNQARRIQSQLQDADRTALAVVGVPEEMAATEAVELYRLARDEVGLAVGAVVLNRCWERRFSPAQEAEVLGLAAERASGRLQRGVPLRGAIAAARRQLRRRKLTSFYKRRLLRQVEAPLLSLPQLYEEPLDRDSLELLADRVEAA
jgi:anion-transporting  ArsA/GET3 family ATPase